jgi:hypothetical protein
MTAIAATRAGAHTLFLGGPFLGVVSGEGCSIRGGLRLDFTIVRRQHTSAVPLIGPKPFQIGM